MGWSQVCGTAYSGVWVLKGDARARVLPANLDHLSVQRRKRGSYETAWVTPGHDCTCSYAYRRVAAVRPQTNGSVWNGVVGVGQGRTLLCPWSARGEVPTAVILNQYTGSGSCIPWHSDNEPLVGPQNSSKLFVRVSLGYSVEFQVRRHTPSQVPSSIRLDHGDILIMDGLAPIGE